MRATRGADGTAPRTAGASPSPGSTSKGMLMVRNRRQRRMQRLCWGFALLAAAAMPAALAAYGCSERDARGDKGPGQLLVGFVGAGEDDALWPVLREGAEAQRLRMPGLALHIEAPPRTSASAQAQILRKLHERGVRALCVQVVDPPALRDVLVWLRTCGVVVVTMGRSIETEPPFDHVGWSEQQLGEEIGRAISQALPTGGRIVMLRPAEPGGPLHDRYLAIRSEVAAYIGLQVFGEYPCSSADEAALILKQSVEHFPDLTGWISVGPWPLLIEPAEAEALTAGRLLIAGDPVPGTWNVLTRCAETAALGPDYGEMAGMALGTARDALAQGGTARRRGSVPLRSIRGHDVDAFRRACLPVSAANAPD